ncbi:MAG: tetratricopeptide repeat protein [Candidatus Cloacimonetes bacterium]|nr:tetratricopeptide repeat protein [Candidatus Cloacimonadota bacterium]
MLKYSFLIVIIAVSFSELNANENIQDLLNNRQLDKAFTELQILGNQNIELWRELGFLYKEENRILESIKCYEQIFESENADYDARLALGRLYMENDQFQKAIHLFQLILENDETDVEAYLGLARTFAAIENYKESIRNYNFALQYLPDYVPTLFELARIYTYSNNLDSAISVYQEILLLDDTFSEALAGIGKLLWWKNLPFQSIQYYKKALILDPTNTEIEDEMRKVLAELDWNLSSKFSLGKESEEAYQVEYFLHNYSVNKRINDYLSLRINSIWQYSQKTENDFTNERYYDSNVIESSFIIKDNQFRYILGGSVNDSTITISEFNWQTNHSFKNIKYRNRLGFGEDYFNFWKRVRKQYLNNSFSVDWKRFNFTYNYAFGRVKRNLIWNNSAKAENPFVIYDLNLQYKISNLPKLTINGNYKFIDYKYDSTLYYSPSNQKIVVLSASIYHPLDKFYFYGHCGISRNSDDTFGTSYEIELGWNVSQASLSLSLTNFNDDYYENELISLSIGGNF